MIVFEDVLSDFMSQIPEIGGLKPFFHWGDELELNRYIKIQNQPYPLVWLKLSTDNYSNNYQDIERDCTFILAARETETEYLNDFRLRRSYDKYLNPLADRLIEGFTKSNQIEMFEQSFKYDKFPNYGSDGENKTIDLWDAAVFRCKLKVKSNCQKLIKWQVKE